MPEMGERRTSGGETREWTGSGWARVQAAAAAPPQAPAGAERYQPGLGDDYGSAFLGELARTGKEAALGVARSPWDMLKGVLGLPGQVVKGLTQDLPTLLKDPSLLKEAPTAVAQGVKDLGDNPREAGSLLGQMLLAPKLPAAGETALARGPGIVGRGMAKVGRGVEATGTSLAGNGLVRTALGGYAAGPVGAAGAAIAPKALELAGKGLQRGGKVLEGADVLGGLRRAAGLEKGPSGDMRAQTAAARRRVEGIPEGDYPWTPERANPEAWRAGAAPEPFVPLDIVEGNPEGWRQSVLGRTSSLDDFLGPEGPKAEFQWPEAGGTFRPNAAGSHVRIEPATEPANLAGLKDAARPSFADEFGITDPETASLANEGNVDFGVGDLSPDTARTLSEVGSPGAQRYIQSQLDRINGPGYESVRDLLDQLHTEPRPMTSMPEGTRDALASKLLGMESFKGLKTPTAAETTFPKGMRGGRARR